MKSPEEINRLLQAAQDHHASGNLRDAFLLLEELGQGSGLSSQLHHRLGLAYQSMGGFGRAIRHYQEALRQDPENPSLLNNLGNSLRSLGRLDDAAGILKRALERDPGKASAHLNLGLTLLSLGNYEEAWDHYEWRLASIPFRRDYHRSHPAWQGQSLNAERLLLYSSQGLGDELLALRYLPLVQQRVRRIILEVQAPLLPLLQDLPGVETVCVRDEKSPPESEFHCEVFSLPRLFGTTPTQIPPCLVPRFAPDTNVRDVLHDQRASHPGHLQIGLVWSGSPHNPANPYRACGLDHFLPLLDLPGLQFFSLQKGIPRQDLDRLATRNPTITDLDALLPDLRACATAIQELDLVITVDTSIPNLAGSLGEPAWVLLHQPADWRWELEPDTSPWFPSLRLFRQSQPRAWQPVIEEVRQELLQRCPV